MNLCAVVVTYNRKELLMQCLDALMAQEVPIKHIIVIDNASTDQTDRLFLKPEGAYLDKGITYLRLQENLGGSGGFHYGIKEAMNTDCDWVIVLDDDAIFRKDFSTRMIEAVNAFPEIQCFTGNVQWYAKGRWRLTQESSESYVEVERVTFVGAMIKRTLIETIGLPERDYFIWYDDTEYSIRMKAETKILCVNQAVAVHLQKEEISSSLSWKKFYGMRNYIIVQMKYLKGPIRKILFLAGYTVKFLVSCVLKQLILGHSVKKFQARLTLGMTAITHGVKNIQGIHPLYQPGKPI